MIEPTSPALAGGFFTPESPGKLKLHYSGHLKRRADTLEKTPMLGKIEGKRRRGWQRMRSLDSITNSMDMNLSKLQKVEDKGNWRAIIYRVKWRKEWYKA